VLPEAVIDPQIAGKPADQFFWVLERHSISPFLAEGLNEPLCFAVGAGRVRPGANVPEAQGAAGLGERLGDIGGAVVAHHPLGIDSLAVEPGNGPAEQADDRWLLLIRQHLGIGETSGVINGHVDLVVTGAIGATLLAVAGDPVPHLAEPGQSLDVDVNQVTGPLPFVALHRRFGLQIPLASETQAAKSPGESGEGSPEQAGDVPKMQTLVTQIHRVLQLLRIERPPLGAANTASIRQKGWTAGAVTGEPAVSTAQADAVLGGEFRKAAAMLQVLGHQPETAPLRHTGIGMAMPECVRSGLMGRTSTRSGLTPPCQLNNLLRQNN
jgi:hypothetical protein